MKQYSLEKIYELSKTDDVQRLTWRITEILHRIGVLNTDALSISASALLLLGLKDGDKGYRKVESFIEYAFPNEITRHQLWGTLSESGLVETDEALLLSVIVGIDNEINVHRFNEYTPAFISDLVLKLLKIGDNKDVVDLCCGIGNFLTKAKVEKPNNRYYGYEINSANVAYMNLKSSLFENYLNVFEENMFNIQNKEFDYIFMNHPFGWRISQNEEALNFVKKYFEKPTQSSFSDWAFILKAVELLKDDGKLVTLVSNGCLYSGLDKEYREYMIKNGYIETVISLPENMYNSTFIPVTMLVITKKANKNIKFVDASELYTKERRKNILSNRDIDTICKAVKKDCEISKTIDIRDVIKYEFNLVAARYIDTDLTTFKNGVEFSSVIKSILRGAPLLSAELDKLSSNEETDYQYLMLANIKNGVIDSNLPYLKEIDSKYEKYCIKNRSLLISKNGAPFKLAVAEIDKDKKVLANGNLYVIEVDEEKADPYYLQAFFMSKAGQQLLNKFVVGSSIPNLPVQSLKTAIIPLPSLEIQRKIAKEYACTIDEINVLNKKIENAKNRLSNCFTNGMKEI